MAQAPNKLFSRAEIRKLLRQRFNVIGDRFRDHADKSHHPVTRGILPCKVCVDYAGQMNAIEDLVRIFGGRL